VGLAVTSKTESGTINSFVEKLFVAPATFSLPVVVADAADAGAFVVANARQAGASIEKTVKTAINFKVSRSDFM
jgi:hypothetical protein